VERLRVLTRRQCCRGQQARHLDGEDRGAQRLHEELLFDDAKKVALEYADAITDTRRDVDDELFASVQRHYDDDTIAELTMIIAWENASSRFNRAFRIPSQGFWKR
jgi:alkylhydroperoxidase family enzyme